MAPLEGPDQVFFAPHNVDHMNQLTNFFFDKLPSDALVGKNFWTPTAMCWTASLVMKTRLMICENCNGVYE